MQDDGYRYKVMFESIDPHQAAQWETRHGTDVWKSLTDDQWSLLRWLPPTTSMNLPFEELCDQYQRLLHWATTHEQPIRNVLMFRSKETEWEPVTPLTCRFELL